MLVEDLADKMKQPVEVLEQWEGGEKQPTIRQAQNLAKKLFIPFGFLFMSEPPKKKKEIPDLRTVGDGERDVFSPEFINVLHDCIRKQYWYREYLQEDGAEPLPFIAKFDMRHSAKTVADDIAARLGVNRKFRNKCASWEDFLRGFMEAAEKVGVLIMRNGVVGNNTRRPLSVKEFRGFALADDIAPLVFLNGKDAKAAQIFTLAHELAHLWIGESGVSNLNPGEQKRREPHKVEKYCNKVAAELLVPEDDFINNWNDAENIEGNITVLSRIYRVSDLVILIRAKNMNKITRNEFFTEYAAYLDRLPSKRSSEGGSAYKTIPVRNSKRLTKAVLNAAYEERVLFREAGSLLGLKNLNTLHALAVEMGIR